MTSSWREMDLVQYRVLLRLYALVQRRSSIPIRRGTRLWLRYFVLSGLLGALTAGIVRSISSSPQSELRWFVRCAIFVVTGRVAQLVRVWFVIQLPEAEMALPISAVTFYTARVSRLMFAALHFAMLFAWIPLLVVTAHSGVLGFIQASAGLMSATFLAAGLTVAAHTLPAGMYPRVPIRSIVWRAQLYTWLLMLLVLALPAYSESVWRGSATGSPIGRAYPGRWLIAGSEVDSHVWRTVTVDAGMALSGVLVSALLLSLEVSTRGFARLTTSQMDAWKSESPLLHVPECLPSGTAFAIHLLLAHVRRDAQFMVGAISLIASAVLLGAATLVTGCLLSDFGGEYIAMWGSTAAAIAMSVGLWDQICATPYYRGAWMVASSPIERSKWVTGGCTTVFVMSFGAAAVVLAAAGFAVPIPLPHLIRHLLVTGLLLKAVVSISALSSDGVPFSQPTQSFGLAIAFAGLGRGLVASVIAAVGMLTYEGGALYWIWVTCVAAGAAVMQMRIRSSKRSLMLAANGLVT